jgi:putative SOS response-associated peptidase YedK
LCQLYRLDSPAGEIAALFKASSGDDPWTPDYVSPGRFAPVIIRKDGARRMVPRQWGVPPPPRVTTPIVNVRNLESPFWIGTLRHTEFRCLVPVTSFMEWSGEKGTRTQSWFTVPSRPIFAFAGLWRDSEVPSFAFLTCEANRLVGAVHPTAMPVILHSEDFDTWLRADWKDAKALVAPFPSQLMVGDVRGAKLAGLPPKVAPL